MNTHRTKEESPPLTSPTNPKLRPNEHAALAGRHHRHPRLRPAGPDDDHGRETYGISGRVVGPAPDDPAAQVADEWIPGDLMNPADVERLAQVVDVLTVEIENVSAEGLARRRL